MALIVSKKKAEAMVCPWLGNCAHDRCMLWVNCNDFGPVTYAKTDRGYCSLNTYFDPMRGV